MASVPITPEDAPTDARHDGGCTPKLVWPSSALASTGQPVLWLPGGPRAQASLDTAWHQAHGTDPTLDQLRVRTTSHLHRDAWRGQKQQALQLVLPGPA